MNQTSILSGGTVPIYTRAPIYIATITCAILDLGIEVTKATERSVAFRANIMSTEIEGMVQLEGDSSLVFSCYMLDAYEKIEIENTGTVLNAIMRYSDMWEQFIYEPSVPVKYCKLMSAVLSRRVGYNVEIEYDAIIKEIDIIVEGIYDSTIPVNFESDAKHTIEYIYSVVLQKEEMK